MIWSYPFGLSFVNTDYYGLGFQHTILDSRVFGSSNTNNPQFASYYFNPILIKELIISGEGFDDNIDLKVNSMNVMSVNVELSSDDGHVEVPIVQGMGMITAIYKGVKARINSLVGIKTLVKEDSIDYDSQQLKYRATLFNGAQYLIFVTLPYEEDDFSLSVTNVNTITASMTIDNLIIQFAVAPSNSDKDGYYEEAVGAYPVDAQVSAYGHEGKWAEYQFSYTLKGASKSGNTMVFLLPHHLESLDDETKDKYTGIKLSSTTKGDMRGYLTNTIGLIETLDYTVQFLPGQSIYYSPDQLQLIGLVINEELSIDIKQAVLSMNSNYFSGKVLDKYAYILLIVNDILGDHSLAQSLLKVLQETMEVFINNEQYYPLMYDTKFGGITSQASQDGDTGAEFGSAYYNDHHFHYGYFIHAAAIIGKVDSQYQGTWIEQNHDWVESLIRDVANPSDQDPFFPVFRNFDWFHGHSWASGLFPAGDGKNEESSSEDYNFAYSIKLWGKVSDNKPLESTGDLMLQIMAKSMNKYFYYTDDNEVEPSQFIGNKVSGILFDNKIHYTTYFGSPDEHPEFVHGIHMIPITPASSIIRPSNYVKQEWNQQIASFIDSVTTGWAGILRLNQALYDKLAAYNFFSENWLNQYLDEGQSRAWSLVFSGASLNL